MALNEMTMKRRYKTGTIIDADRLDVTPEFLARVSIWTSFYRCYVFIFAEHFLGVKLEMFQKIILHGMMHNQYSCFIASRGLGKSWIVAIYVICRAILYPNSKIVLSAGSRKQSMEVINYIKAFADDSECLRNSIRYLSDNINNPKIEFHGGSTVRVAIAHDNARGARANVLVLDEFRMISKQIYDTVLRQFASDRRNPKFLRKSKYADYPREENCEVLLTSAYYCHHWAYDKFKDYFEQITQHRKKNYFLIDLPYQLSIKVGLKSEQQIASQMSENTFNPLTWSMEMEGKWVGSTEGAYFQYETIEPCRKLFKPFYTREIANLLNSKTKKFVDTRKNRDLGEIRVLFSDIAIMGGSDNDATIIGLMRLIPQEQRYKDRVNKYYIREVVYMESMVGTRTDEQALILRRLFEQFECDYLVMDGRGGGASVFDELSKPMVDMTTGEEYPIPLTSMNYEKFAERCNYPNAKRVVYVVNATAPLNSEMAMITQDLITKRRIKFLVSETEAKETLENIKGFTEFPSEVKAKIMEQYLQSSALINEMINLKKIESELGLIKLVEPSRTMRKDRYSALSYCLYFTSILESELDRGSGFFEEDDDIVYFYN